MTPDEASSKIADLKRQLAAERDHGKRLQQQLDAILRTDTPSPSEADGEAVQLLERWLERLEYSDPYLDKPLVLDYLKRRNDKLHSGDEQP